MLISSQNLSATTYNSLPIVEDADAIVRSSKLIDVMTEELAPVFLAHQMEDDWGIALLHHHWPILDDEIPGEHVNKLEDSLEYVMQPIVRGCSSNYVPSLLSAVANSDSTFQPLEFSSDPQAVRAHARLEENFAFLSDVHSRLIERGLAKHFGLISIKRPSAPDRKLVEFTQLRRASIVREVDGASIDPKMLIQTCWIFSMSADKKCKRDCFKTCTVPSDGGKHYSTHNALHNPNG